MTFSLTKKKMNEKKMSQKLNKALEKRLQIQGALIAGNSYGQIIKKLKVSRNTIRRVKKYGVAQEKV